MVVDTGDVLQYTDLVIAVGSMGPYPGKPEFTTVKELQEASKAGFILGHLFGGFVVTLLHGNVIDDQRFSWVFADFPSAVLELVSFFSGLFSGKRSFDFLAGQGYF